MNASIETWLAHIRALAVDIGPRGPTTEGEHRGAAYCTEVFRKMDPAVMGRAYAFTAAFLAAVDARGG